VRKATILFATGFGLGLSPIASGTAGSLLGLLLAAAMPFRPLIVQICLAAALVLLAIPICTAAERHFGKKDDGRIVADEYLTFPICVLGLPWLANPWLLAVAFLTHRLLDVIKPFPAWRLQRLEGGVGIVLDDVVSSLYALAVNYAVYFVFVGV